MPAETGATLPALTIAKFDKALHDRSAFSCGFAPIDNFLKSSLSDQVKDGMVTATGQPESSLCTACFTGTYPIELPAADRLGKNLLERTEDPAACNPGPDSELDRAVREAAN